jgi:hypothetical protein
MKKLYTLVALMFVATSIFAQLNESFEGTTFPPVGWKSLDVDGDGMNWGAYTVTSSNIAHTGTYTAASASWDSQTELALTPNNWLITPGLKVTSATDSVTFWIAPQDKKWPGEHIDVKLSTTGINQADFTTTLYSKTFTFADTLVDWHYVAKSLSSYVGDTVYVAFIHSNCTDMFMLKLDDVKGPATYIPAIPDLTVQALLSPVSKNGLTNAETVKVLLKNVGYGAATGYTVSYQKGTLTPVSQVGNTSIAAGDTMTFTFTTPVNFSAIGTDSIRVWVSLAADVVKTNDTLAYTEITNIAPSTLPMNMGFEATDNLENWILRNLNGGGTWSLGSTAALAHGGSRYAAFNYNATIPGDDWLISNGISMTAGQNLNLSFYYRVRADLINGVMTIFPEKLNVYFMKTNEIKDTLTKLVDYPNIMDTVYQHSVSSFTVPSTGIYHIGFHAYSDPDMWQLLIDDISVGVGASVNEVATDETFRTFPNPAREVVNIISASVIKSLVIYNALGQEVYSVNPDTDNVKINTSAFENGVYVVKATTANGQKTTKLVIK